MITIAEEIEVASSSETVWSVLSDLSEVVSCIGGAELGEQHDDGSFDAGLTVKFGGLRVTFRARATLTVDHAEREGRLVARGTDRQGATRLTNEATFRVRPAPAGTGSHVSIDGTVALAGKLASVIDAGGGVVVARMTREFAESLTGRCAVLEAPTNGGRPRSEPTRKLGRLARVRAWLDRVLAGRPQASR
jgi:carbon monoxide dehydrogenase subunit G